MNKLSETLFNNQDLKENKYLIDQNDQLNLKLKNIIKIPEKRDLYERFLKINSELKPDGYMVISKKQEKALLKEKTEILNELPQQLFKQLEIWISLENELNKINKEIDFNKNKLKIHINKLLKFLEEKEMFNGVNISQKGRIVAEINECNSLIMAKIIESSLLDDLEFDEIMGVLSLFIADKDKEEIFLSDLNLSLKEEKIIKTIVKFSDEVYNDEIKIVQETPFYFSSDFNLSLNMYNSIKTFVNTSQLESLNFEGNFIKNVLRLSNLTKNIETIAKLLNNIKLFNKLDGFQEKLIKGIVITDSLYI
jgi:superfamily II RNA helicase